MSTLALIVTAFAELVIFNVWRRDRQRRRRFYVPEYRRAATPRPPQYVRPIQPWQSVDRPDIERRRPH